MDRPVPFPLPAPRPDDQPRLYVVDDDPGVLEVISRFARPHGFVILPFRSPTAAVAEMMRNPPDAALVDLRMPGMNGLEFLREIKRRAPFCDVVLMTAFGTIDTAVEAVKLGACEYLSKPFDFDRLRDLLVTIREECQRRRQVSALEGEITKHARFQGMIGRSPAMVELFGLIRRIAPHFTTALITGETGSGKELVARALHALSKRKEKPFVTLNCSAVVETLFESELFGHTRGAFTGATDARSGLFEKANGGVIFLDEVGELPAPVQAKLLRVLEDGEMTRVGSSEPQHVDVRVLAATNRVLEREVHEGRFRADLYYRLHVVNLPVPPLRERRDDILLIARAFAEDFSKDFGRVIAGFTPDAEQQLQSHDWPGNVRELRNVLGRACMLVDGEWIDRADIVLGRPLATRGPSPMPGGTGPVRPIQEVERDEILRALDETNGNKKEAARRLGISRRALYRRLEKFRVGPPYSNAA